MDRLDFLSTRHGQNGTFWRAVALMSGMAVLAGCDDATLSQFLQPKDKTAQSEPVIGTKPGKSTKLVERDIEAPEVFQVTEAGLWDGRPSLGGVWVAHPEVEDPQRVIIRNSANGKFVIGALFRRERSIPGPRIQASSDAADALGMLAGAPSKLNITALIREPAPQAPEEVVEIEEAPIEAVVADVPEIKVEEIAAAALAEPAASTAGTDTTITEKALDPIAAAAAAIEAAGTSTAGATKKIATAALAEAKPSKPSTPSRKPKTSNLDKPYIQIGIFSVKANADQTAGQMRSAGIVPTVFDQKSNGKRFWRVVIGPSQSKSERATLLKQVKSAGFSDAYFVTN